MARAGRVVGHVSGATVGTEVEVSMQAAADQVLVVFDEPAARLAEHQPVSPSTRSSEVSPRPAVLWPHSWSRERRGPRGSPRRSLHEAPDPDLRRHRVPDRRNVGRGRMMLLDTHVLVRYASEAPPSRLARCSGSFEAWRVYTSGISDY